MTQYREPVNGVGVRVLPERMRAAIKAVQDIMPPNTGVIVFAFDFGEGGGMSYISNAERDGAVASLKEWIARQERA